MAITEYVERAEKERISKKIQFHLNDWKEPVVLLYAIILWEKKWFPAITVTWVTILYFYATWLMSDCSMMRTIYTVGLYVTLIDCFVCGLFQKLLPPNSWNEDKERAYIAIADTLAHYFATFKLFTERFFNFRRTRSALFHVVLAALFITILYAVSNINTLFKLYITVLLVVLYPVFTMRTKFIGDSLLKYFPFC